MVVINANKINKTNKINKRKNQMKKIYTILLLALSTSILAAGPNCDTILTVDDVKQQCSIDKVKYKKSKHEAGKDFFYCVREVRKSYGNSVMLNISHYEDKKNADKMALAGMGRDDVEIEKITLGQGGVAYHSSHKIMGGSYFVRYRKNNTFVELKYNHTARDKPFCNLNDVKALAAIIESRLE
jgi:hypothetical protein